VIFNILGNQLRQITVASWRARRIYVYVVEKKNRVR
jgi:mRNA-degrading endonuclease HigB of HigAB toxin-antitoxin module